jgi:hypothetical protein
MAFTGDVISLRRSDLGDLTSGLVVVEWEDDIYIVTRRVCDYRRGMDW